MKRLRDVKANKKRKKKQIEKEKKMDKKMERLRGAEIEREERKIER
jgi:hypothetical protein